MRDIIILGCGPTCADCKYDTEVWGVNSVAAWNERLDKLFFFDDLEAFNPMVMTIADVANSYNRGVELVTTQKNAEYCRGLHIPTTIYPLSEIVAEYHTAYFANSIAYMLAYAMREKADKVKLYGIDHLTFQTYILERACLEYWLGRMVERGIEVEIASGSALLKTGDGKLYGYDHFFNTAASSLDRVIVA